MDTASNDELFDSKSCDEEEFTTLMLKYSGVCRENKKKSSMADRVLDVLLT
ncbi:hypothetical protein L916_10268 [Phytophthora nicotianae]|uniref:Uncharacterized protein n=1 Tax=Phytophthora nicotianae TaxID=4792 RepID=W2IVG9_PHYNI|nr:hypothetical protein L916_10268 [Phytophthora nicotianae]